MNGFRIERISKEHLGAVAELERLCFSAPWSEKSLELLLGNEAYGLTALSENGKVLGYVGLWLAPGEGEITDICVSPDHRREGIGKKLMEELIAYAGSVGLESLVLEVREGNQAAQKLYQTIGFTVAGVRKNFYQNPTEHALVMVLNLKQN